jgi:hypothetical protein
VRAITLEKTPRGVAKLRTRADAPPISHFVNEFEAGCFVDYAQDETAIRTRYRLARKSFSSTHARNIQQSAAPGNTPKKRTVSRVSVKAPKFDYNSALENRAATV